jgi:hypothetical protein
MTGWIFPTLPVSEFIEDKQMVSGALLARDIQSFAFALEGR